MPKPKLDTLRVMVPSEGDWDPSEAVYQVRTPHAFTQVIGYVKHTLREDGHVYFRGQRQSYPKMLPSLFRDAVSWSGVHRRVEAVDKIVNGAAESFIKNTPKHAFEPLLQHYFLRTRWLDAVDNAWIALWFACHDVHLTGRKGEFAHFAPRESGSAYVILINTGAITDTPSKPGMMQSDKLSIIDLRRAAPSMYLRPHAQHGLLLRRRRIEKLDDIDLEEFVVATIRVDVKDAMRWIGGSMLSVHHLFPPPHYDSGYRMFLDSAIAYNQFVGKVAHIGA